MKFILSLFLISFSFLASANNDATISLAPDTHVSWHMYDGRKNKKNKKNKRINRKRKRKCKQFGRRVYAG